jgi:hypothetical protein
MHYRRHLATIAAVAATALALPAHAGGVKTLDGKKTKALTFALKSSPQENDTTLIGDVASLVDQKTPFDRPADYSKCPKTRCLSYSFKYKPAKGVKPGPVSVKISWNIPGQDYDLYVIENGALAGQCAASAGTSEVVVLPSPTKNRIVTVVVDEFRAAPDTVSGQVTFPAKDIIKKTSGDPQGAPIDCGLS